MVDYSTKKDVQSLAREFREGRDAMDWSATIDDLLEQGGLSAVQFSSADRHVLKLISPSEWSAAVAEKTESKIKAMISLRENLVLVADDLQGPKIPFAKGHELGHSQIPWHRDILYVCDEFDLTQSARDQLEFEANVFSAEVLVPATLLSKVYAQCETSMKTVLLLNQWSGASIEVCANQYVANHPSAVALLVCKVEDGDEGRCLRVTRKSLSPSAVKTPLANAKKGQVLPPAHNICRSIQSGRVGMPIAVELSLGKSDTQYEGSVFNNGYTVLALMFATS